MDNYNTVVLLDVHLLYLSSVTPESIAYTEKQRRLIDFPRKRPTIILYVKGYDCVPCYVPSGSFTMPALCQYAFHICPSYLCYLSCD